MADLTVVAANVDPTASTITRTGIAGEAITAGQALFMATDGELELAQHDVDAAEAACVGIALNDAAAGQYVTYAISGDVNMGAIMTVGAVYIVGVAEGGIAPEADAGTGDFVTVIGVATTTSNLKMGILQSGVAHA